MIHKNIKNRMDVTEKKVTRKQNIAAMHDYHYKYLGQLRKGKVHCSCPECSPKTNTTSYKSRGSVSRIPTDVPGKERVKGNRPCTSFGRHGKKNYKSSDLRKIISTEQALQEYQFCS